MVLGLARPSARALTEDVGRFDRTRLTPGAAARAAGGVAFVLTVGLLADSVAAAVSAAAGAFSVGTASIEGAYRTRVLATVATSVAMGLSTFVGGLVIGSAPLAVLAAAAWGFAAGMATALGPAATGVGLQAGVALLVAGSLEMSLREAATRGLLVLAGGLVQTVLVVSVWPLRTYAAERGALAGVYRALAAYAGDVSRPPPGSAPAPPPPADPLSVAADVLSDPNPLGRTPTHVGFRSLLDLAARSRIELAALAQARERAVRRGLAGQAHRIEAVLEESEHALLAIADELTPWAAARERGGWQALPSSPKPGQVPLGGLRPSVVSAVEALRGQLRAASRVATGLTTRNGPAAGATEELQLFEVTDPRLLPSLREPALSLRAAFDLQTETMRHALRLAGVLAMASVLFRVLPLSNGYWVPLTALVVLRPDFSSTMRHGAARVAGTAVGAFAATVAASELRPSPGVLLVLISASAFLAFTVFFANQALFDAFLTAYVVFLLALVGLPSSSAGPVRVLDTAIGGALALLAYVLWPTWERGRVRERLAGLIEAQAAYAVAVLGAYAEPGSREGAALGSAQAVARRARGAAEASVERFVQESAAHGLAPDTAHSEASMCEGVIAAAQRNAQAILSLHAHVPQRGSEALPEADELARMVLRAAASLAAALEKWQTPQGFPALRPFQLELRAALGDATERRQLLVLDSDVIVDALDTMAHLVRQGRSPTWRTPPAPPIGTM